MAITIRPITVTTANAYKKVPTCVRTKSRRSSADSSSDGGCDTIEMITGRTVAKPAPTMIMTSSTFSAKWMSSNCQFATAFWNPRRRTSATVRFIRGASNHVAPVVRGAGERHERRHLVQPAAQPRTDARAERLLFRFRRRIGVVRGEDRRPLFVVARVDHVIKDVLYKRRRLLRSELVEHEQVAFEQRTKNRGLARHFIGVERGLDLLNQILKITEEHASRFAAGDDLRQRRDREMRFAGAARSHEQQSASFIGGRPQVDELLHARFRVLQHRRFFFERSEGAMFVSLGNVRAHETLPAPQVSLTSARFYAQRITGNRDPSGAVAARANRRFRGSDHRDECSIAPRYTFRPLDAQHDCSVPRRQAGLRDLSRGVGNRPLARRDLPEKRGRIAPRALPNLPCR